MIVMNVDILTESLFAVIVPSKTQQFLKNVVFVWIF
jgi:hypothetical protein